jgi:hypothetical protein
LKFTSKSVGGRCDCALKEFEYQRQRETGATDEQFVLYLFLSGGFLITPNSTAEQREKGVTDFNDLALENGRLAKQQLEEAVWRARHKGDEQTAELGKGLLRLDSWAGRREIACEILKETPHRFLVRLGEDCLLPGGRQATKGQDVYVSKDAIRRDQAVCIESEIVQQ